MSEVWLFIMAVARHWIVLSGGTAIITLVGIGERYYRSSLSWPLYWSLLIVLFFVASFLAWRDEHHSADAMRQKVDDQYPQVDARIEQMHLTNIGLSFDGVTETTVPVVIVLMRILNTGAASIFQNYDLRIRRENGQVLRGALWLPPANLAINIDMAAGRTHQVPFGQSLDERTMTAVGRGSLVRGRLIWVFRSHRYEEINQPGLEYEVRFEDAWFPATPEHTVSTHWQPKDPMPHAFPGLGMSSPVLEPPQPQKGKPPERKRRRK